MAAILQFEKRTIREKVEFEPGHTATILLFTGVRFERIDFEQMKMSAPVLEAARRAN